MDSVWTVELRYFGTSMSMRFLVVFPFLFPSKRTHLAEPRITTAFRKCELSPHLGYLVGGAPGSAGASISMSVAPCRRFRLSFSLSNSAVGDWLGLALPYTQCQRRTCLTVKVRTI